MSNHNQDTIERRRSLVRVLVTYASTLFLYFGGVIVIVWLLIDNQHVLAKDTFLAILPIAAAVISFWFATRKASSKNSKNDPQNKNEGSL